MWMQMTDCDRHPTVCVTCVWAGVDSVWEQRKLKATLCEMLAAGAAQNPQRPAARPAAVKQRRGARFVGWFCF
jgi:hypothetical protein